MCPVAVEAGGDAASEMGKRVNWWPYPVLIGPKGDELQRLRRENRQLKLEILAKAATWFAREAGSIPSGTSSS